MNKSKNKKKLTITTVDTVPRIGIVTSLNGKARTFADRKRKLKSDVVGRKAKHSKDARSN